jgi:hypothetical protein
MGPVGAPEAAELAVRLWIVAGLQRPAGEEMDGKPGGQGRPTLMGSQGLTGRHVPFPLAS